MSMVVYHAASGQMRAKPDADCRRLLGDLGIRSFDDVEQRADKAKSELPRVWEMAEAFSAMGCPLVVIKRGKVGQYVWDSHSKSRWHIPSYPTHVRDVTGAGDAYCGGFLVGYQRSQDPVEAALFGSVSASLTVEGVGPLYALDAHPALAEHRLNALRAQVRTY